MRRTLTNGCTRRRVLLRRTLSVVGRLRKSRRPKITRLLGSLTATAFGLNGCSRMRPLLRQTLTVCRRTGCSRSITAVLCGLTLFCSSRKSRTRTVFRLRHTVPDVREFGKAGRPRLKVDLRLLTRRCLVAKSRRGTRSACLQTLSVFRGDGFSTNTTVTLKDLKGLCFRRESCRLTRAFLRHTLTLRR